MILLTSGPQQRAILRTVISLLKEAFTFRPDTDLQIGLASWFKDFFKSYMFTQSILLGIYFLNLTLFTGETVWTKRKVVQRYPFHLNNISLLGPDEMSLISPINYD